MNNTNNQEAPEFPREITFKIVFYNEPNLIQTIKSCINETELLYELSDKISANGKFISFTVSAEFPSEEILSDLCTNLKSIEGYKMMF